MSHSLTDLAGLTVSAEDFLAAVLESTAQPIWVVDPKGRIRFANPAAIEALGYESANELFGRDGHETIHYLHPDGTPYAAAHSPMLLPRTTGETVASDLDWFVRRDGSMIPVSYVSAPIEMPEGRGAVVAFHDAEDRVRGERLRREHEAILAAQRRVATLVAGGAASGDVFAAIAREVGRVIGLPLVALWRYESDGTATVIGAWSEHPHPFQAGSRWPLEGPTICARVLETGRPARIDDFANIPGRIADAAREAGIHACAGAPIIVDGEVWGAMSTDSTNREPLPPDIEDRLAEFTALVATAISNSAGRDELARLADEQAALLRVATRVAEGMPAAELLAAVAEEAGTLLDVDGARIARFVDEERLALVADWTKLGYGVPSFDRVKLEGRTVSAEVLRTGRVSRIDDYADIAERPAFARGVDVSSVVGAPIVVEGRLWGVMIAWSRTEALPGDTEPRLTELTELVATAISNSEARSEVARLAEEQAALRRVATLVAQVVSSSELFAAVAEEVGRLIGADVAGLIRYEADETVTALANWAAVGDFPGVGSRRPLDEAGLATTIWRTGRPGRMEDYEGIPADLAVIRERFGLRSSVGTPILVEGRLWGALAVHSKQAEPLPANTESRLSNFAELVATAVANAHARAETQRLVDEQAALRRVATLVARAVPPSELFAAVAEEVGTLLDADLSGMVRFEGDGRVAAVAVWSALGEHPDVPESWVIEEGDPATLIAKTRGPVRIDDWSGVPGPLAAYIREEVGIRSSVGSPILVEGRLWGALAVHSKQAAPLPANTESRLLNFTELVGTAVANAQARADVGRLADEQAALRRVATLVAREASPAKVFAAVAEEVGRFLPVQDTAMLRYEDDGTSTVLASWGSPGHTLPLGTRMAVGGENATSRVHRTGRSARIDDYSGASGSIGEHVRELGATSAVGCPILVAGRLWGVMVASQHTADPLPAETESRVAKFTELIATALSNIEARSDLAASRARIVATTDDTRRRFERDLHDGAQQRLVSLSVTLRDAQMMIPAEFDEPRAQLTRVGEELAGALDDLRELSRGIHPAILSEGGIGPALKALARRSAVPVKLDLRVDGRLEERLEVTVYYVASEALANAAKHAEASVVAIRVEACDGRLDIVIEDDGAGGADPAQGSGLTGLADRVEALGGTIAIESPAGQGTSMRVELPVEVAAGPD